MQNVQNMQNMQNMKKCAKYTEYAKPVNAWVRSTFSYVFYLGKLSQSHQQAILMSNSPMKCTLDFYSMPASASGWGQQSISSLALCLEYLVFKELLCHFSHKMNQKEAKNEHHPGTSLVVILLGEREGETGQCALLPEPVSFLPAGLTLFWFCFVCKLITLPILRFHFPNYGG